MLISKKPRLFYLRRRDGSVRLRKYGQDFNLTKTEANALRTQFMAELAKDVRMYTAVSGENPEVIQ